MNDQTKSTSVPTPTALTSESGSVAPTINTPVNPLEQFFRVTQININLPTQGKFWPEGTLELKEDGTIDILPMTARDEIIMKSPEGLLSGSSVAETIESCIPGIKNAYTMPSHDIDTCMIAIRIASYGPGLTLTNTCPECSHINEDRVDLRALLDSIPIGNIPNVDTINGLTFEFHPYDWNFINSNNKRAFENEQSLRSAKAADLSEDEKQAYFKGIFDKLTTQSISAIVLAIKQVSVEGKIVTDRNYIQDFIDKADRGMIDKIRKSITKMNSSVEYPDVDFVCDECKIKYTKQIEFNQSTFFE